MPAQDGGTTIPLPREGTQTAELCLFLDELFDSLNASRVNSTKLLRRGATPEDGRIEFWNGCLKIIKTMYFIDENADRRKEIRPPTLSNLAMTVNNFKLISTKLWQAGFKRIMTRSLNQDPIENLFGQIRQRAARANNPTISAFGPLYKSLLVKNISGKHSLGGNCERDNSVVYFTLKEFLQQVCRVFHNLCGKF